MTVIGRRVQEVKDELRERRGLDVNHVIMTSDERDPAWWADVAAQGWLTVDHSNTAELYGNWWVPCHLSFIFSFLIDLAFNRYPVLIDAVIQSSGVGFVGTYHSTMSILAARRVETWNNGVYRQVQWGSPGADDH
jgi:hypothetical protein